MAASGKVAEGIGAVVAETLKMKQAAETALAKAVADVAIAETAVGAAMTAHAAQPTDDGTRVHAADRALRLAHVRLSAATKEAEDTAEGHRMAVAAFDHDQNARHVAELQKRAAIPTLEAAIDAPWAEILAAYDRIKAAAFKIREAFLASTAASAELRSRGVYEQDLSPFHLVRVPLERAAGKGLGTSSLTAVAPALSPHADPTREVLSALERIENLSPGPNNEWLRRQLAHLPSARTGIDLDALERDHGQRAAVGALDGYTPPTRQRATTQ